jgi:YVTN family beta-propeller protein
MFYSFNSNKKNCAGLRKALLLSILLWSGGTFCQIETHIRKKTEIKDGIAPKSVVSSGNGLFSAQNMMYRHTITLYNQTGELLAKINDGVKLSAFGFSEYGTSRYRGAPVEGAFTKDGKYLWVSNYNMSGEKFTNPGCDACIGKDYDPSFLYKIDTENYTIANVIKVGSVPKFLAISPDEKTLIVSNWVSSDVSIVDLETETEVKRVTVGAHPRGVAITQDSKLAYVTVMGSTKIAVVNLEDYTVNYLTNVGKSPRSVLLADHDSTLYVSLNSSNEIMKYNCFSGTKSYCKTESGPRSMTLSPNGKSLYVVNYFDDVFTKINTDSMLVEAVIPTSSKPIGICGNWLSSEIWVACYSGKIEVFKDFKLEKELYPPHFLGFELPTFNFNISPVADTVVIDTALVAEEPIKDTFLAITPRVLEQNRPYRHTPPLVDEEAEILAVIETAEEPIKDNYLNITPKVQSQNRTVKHPPPPANKDSEPIETAEIRTNPESCDFHLIVGAFSHKENAEKKKKQLLKEGYPAEVIIGAQYNYVSIACYANEEIAEEGKTEMRQKSADFSSAWVLAW